MLAIILIIFSILLGLVVENKVDFSRNMILKLAFSIVIGTLLFTWINFVLALVIGFNELSLIFTLTTEVIIIHKLLPKKSLQLVKKAWQHKTLPRYLYLLIAIFSSIYFFGIFHGHNGELRFTGNFLDLPFHTAICQRAVEHFEFPLEHPQSSGYPLVYHFLIDFHSAILSKAGIPCIYANIYMNSILSICLVLLLYAALKSIVKRNKAVFWAMLLFITAHNGIMNLIFYFLGQDFAGVSLAQHVPLTIDRLQAILTYPYFNLLNVNVNLFQPQRPFLIGFSVAMICIRLMIRYLKKRNVTSQKMISLSIFIGLLPLFHLHSFLIILPCFVVFLLLNDQNIIIRIRSFITAFILFLPQLYFIVESRVTDNTFTKFNFPEEILPYESVNNPLLHRLYFWIRTASPILIFGYIALLVLAFANRKYIGSKLRKLPRHILFLIAVFSITVGIFLLINVVQFSPSWGDNNKLFVYHLLALCALSGYAVSLITNKFMKWIIAAIILITTTFPFTIEQLVMWQRKMDYETQLSYTEIVFNPAEQQVATWVKSNTQPDDVFLTSNAMMHFLPTLTGRVVVNGAYTYENGVQKSGIVDKVREYYLTFNSNLLQDLKVDYILVSPKEISAYSILPYVLEGQTPVYELDDVDWGNYKIFRVSDLKINYTEMLPENAQFLGFLTPSSEENQYRKLKIGSGLENHALTLGNQVFVFGMATHAQSHYTYKVDTKYQSFTGVIGLDAANGCDNGSVVFRIATDGQEVFKSPIMRIDSQPITIHIDLSKTKILELFIEDGGDGITCDHATWANPFLIEKDQTNAE